MIIDLSCPLILEHVEDHSRKSKQGLIVFSRHENCSNNPFITIHMEDGFVSVKEANFLLQFTDKIVYMVIKCKFLAKLDAKIFIFSDSPNVIDPFEVDICKLL